MKVKQVKGIMCPECDTYLPSEDIPAEELFYQCGECEEVYADREEAKECCKE